MKIQAQVNPEMVILAREFRGLTQKDLALKAVVTQPQIARVEAGIEQSASDEVLERIAKALNFPMSFLTSNENRLGFGSSSVFYRKKSSLTAANRKQIEGVTNLSRIAIKKTLDAVDIQTKLQLPKYDLDLTEYTAKQVAERVRAMWLIPDGAVQNLTSLVESAGVIIVEADFGTNGIDGTSIWVAETPPFIFLNKNLPPDRYRFTLAHELGHLVLHDIPHERMEEEADEFASELLMQTSEFKAATFQFGSKPTLRQLAQIKPYWKVSIASMIMKLHQLNHISDAQKKSFFIMMNTAKIRMNEPQGFEKEKPLLLKKIINASIKENGFNENQITDFLKLPIDVVMQLFGSFLQEGQNRKPHLHLV
ncbi:MAG: ImmA/IrrE family metallo-endopeptidase [Methylotenera sp.]|nr:ImmA/IrrE family metallo-endopeptidase [Methylotenera sp.]